MVATPMGLAPCHRLWLAGQGSDGEATLSPPSSLRKTEAHKLITYLMNYHVDDVDKAKFTK